jgi:hypothetical protein
LWINDDIVVGECDYCMRRFDNSAIARTGQTGARLPDQVYSWIADCRDHLRREIRCRRIVDNDHLKFWVV